jgi:hypothetical protein
MSHNKSNLHDIEFNLLEVLRRQDVFGAGDEMVLEAVAADLVSSSEGGSETC